MKVLIVDDSRAMRLIVTRMLRRAGYLGAVCREAGSGREALDMVRADPPDLILSDWRMADGDGMSLLAQIRASGSDIVFGFVTGDATGPMRKAAAAAGANFLIAKPFDVDTLRQALSGRAWLATCRQHVHAAPPRPEPDAVRP